MAIRQLGHKILKRTAQMPLVGRPASAVTHALGLDGISRKLCKYSKYVPATVSFQIADRSGRRRTGRMFGHNGNDHVVAQVWQSGLAGYEQPLPELFMTAVRQSDAAVLDVGANTGLYAVIAGLATDAPVHAFEPFPPALDFLRKNLELNDLTGRVTVVPKAVGGEPGEAKLYVPAKKFGEVVEQSASLNRDFRPEHSQVLNVPVVTLDDYVRESGIDRASVVLIDVEGFEPAVLAGAARTMKDLRPLMFLEVVQKENVAPVTASCDAADYRPLWLHPDRLVDRREVASDYRAGNHLLYPREKREAVEQLAAGLKLPIVKE